MAANSVESIAMLLSMGFSREQSAQALAHCGGNLELAINQLLSGGDIGGGGGSSGVRVVHSDVSQYSDSNGRSACTSIALTMACRVLDIMTTDDPEAISMDPAFLSNCVQEGIALYSDISSKANGVEHSSVEELMGVLGSSNVSTAKSIASTLKLLDSSPRQGILSNSSDNPMGLEAVLNRCQRDGSGSSYIAVIITKPPETVLVLLPPQGSASRTYVLLDSHPRPQQLAPHCPSGSYALIHPTLSSLVGSIKQIFPVTELGSDVPEMMAMMYNSFDAYPFQRR
ncbi:hypothetical protein ACHAXT_000317 [Thalassiosira profunda]